MSTWRLRFQCVLFLTFIWKEMRNAHQWYSRFDTQIGRHFCVCSPMYVFYEAALYFYPFSAIINHLVYSTAYVHASKVSVYERETYCIIRCMKEFSCKLYPIIYCVFNIIKYIICKLCKKNQKNKKYHTRAKPKKSLLCLEIM